MQRKRSVGRVLSVLFAVALVALVMPGSANHPQNDTGKSIVFDHKSGNQYWVEATIGGASSSQVAKVEAQTYVPDWEPWTELTKRSWGAYAASFPISDGVDVRFRATFNDGTQAVSCWFTHPAGVEKCTYAQPSGTWTSTIVGDVGAAGYGGAVDMADSDSDGLNEAFVASRAGLHQFEQNGAIWTRTLVHGPPAPGYGFEQVAIGDTARTEGYAPREVYTTGWVYDGTRGADRLMMHHNSGIAWSSEEVFAFGQSIQDLAFGDVDDDGDTELFILTEHGGDDVVYLMWREPGQFYFREVARTSLDLQFASVADADRDLDQELYIAFSSDSTPSSQGVLRVDFDGTSYVKDVLFAGNLGTRVTGIVAGDGDADGLDEVYVLMSDVFGPSSLQRFSPRTEGWAQTTIPLGQTVHSEPVLADADNDGRKELYMGTLEGQLVQVRWSGSAWVVRALHQLGSGERVAALVVGDAGLDAKNEVYEVSFDSNRDACCPTTHLQRVAASATLPQQFDATFTGVRGNQWWEQASVSATGGVLAKVDVRLNNGAWQPLTKQSWGGWAASYQAIQGTTVQLRATSTTGATDLSSCYHWIPASGTDATVIACNGTNTTTSTTTTTTGSAFDASFTGVKGNQWWVQANVAGNQPLAGVDARVNCVGSWHPLVKQDWGGWAASFNIPAGSKVDFRARSTIGGTDLSGGYTWTAATPTSGC